MLVLTDRIKIESLDDMSASEIQQIDIRLRTLLLCLVGTIPGSRDFGMEGDYLDDPIDIAANGLASALQEKVDIFIPEISVESVDISYDLNGKLETTIRIERSDVA